ncbi:MULTISPECIES: phosphatidate cytidylyltransferase [Paracoccus]|jgi:phosphatidate cytidylyltransferase|uniref:Phosphatidate cytidylyltransferase n=2 Tax=Paracoccus TaxID=265 RepID=A0A5C4RBC2_9RHOB|nr:MULTISPECIES: phosphatidate cytidylyltransferase [Paracoccus]MBF5078088.1 phosphatidate cytidylyltransferase [Paracoccus sp. NBH48]MCO6365025.1 phosphatidate cytidylyltransferase [Paracoccus sp. 08]TNB92642.1 phosphatidate cytidylyltransferase [Paracoccus marcusii]TNH41218.1 phosphatidate cytidylyltransferase [Paracoccus haeundaensis]WDA11937.1 phosphatidate cytidylyltransferase [Paracoccus marcusii]
MTSARHSAGSVPGAGGPGKSGGKWGDLSRRVASTLVLLGIGVMLAVAQGPWLRLGMAVISAITFWELAAMTGWRNPARHVTLFGRSRPIALAAIAGVSQAFALTGMPWAWVALAVPILLGLPGAARRDRATYTLFGIAILIVAFGLVGFRENYGLNFVLWLMGVIIISDTAGYFFGRILGGPKFWPALSPKKTWSGTIAGWIGTCLFGAILWMAGQGDATLIWVSPIVCLAGQMGDLAESWLKRRAGVKDSSNLIPGHGGFMDRFDAVTGAVLATMLIGFLTKLPVVN